MEVNRRFVKSSKIKHSYLFKTFCYMRQNIDHNDVG